MFAKLFIISFLPHDIYQIKYLLKGRKFRKYLGTNL